MSAAATLPNDADLLGALGGSLEPWAAQCHAASCCLVNSGVLGTFSRVARGTARGVGSQHSWVVVGRDCYAPDAVIIDPTLWSFDVSIQGIWRGSAKDGRHTPHGAVGSIWEWGKPGSFGGTPVPVTPDVALSPAAQHFLELLGPLDMRGWMQLCNAPVRGWPAAEIIAAIADTPGLGAGIIPIDRLGMLTDRNPGGLYLRTEVPLQRGEALP